MSQELTHKQSGNALHYASPEEGTPSGLYKIRIPKGAQSWFLVTQTGNLPVPCSVVMSIDTPPDAARAVEVGPDYRTVLQRLWAGEALRSDTPANSGVLSVSASERGAWRADRERWVYLQFDFGPYKCRSMQGRIDLHADAVTEQPDIDAALLERTRQYVNASGYTDAIRAFGGFGPGEDAALVAKATSCGLVKALTDMVRMAEQSAASRAPQ